MFAKLKQLLVGKPKDLEDPDLFHSITLIAFLAWVGLGADGLSSSAYGPEEAFKGLHGHWYLAVFLAAATALTVFIISLAYTGIIEHFPSGGGGYVVATKLLGEKFGLISGSALLIDYILTITTSIASGVEAIFSSLPSQEMTIFGHHYNLTNWHVPVEVGAIVILIIMNLRGVKESINVLVPIFLLFLATHAVLLGSAFFMKAGELPHELHNVAHDFNTGLHDPTLGFVGMLLIFIHAYSMGAGTFTGIEAVSNGLQIMREPRVKTGKRTMIYMAISLAVTAGGILLSYLLFHVGDVQGVEHLTLNAVLLQTMTASWTYGRWFMVVALVSEAALLTVAAQTGFIDGPRVMANMGLDSWLPHRFSALSERLTMHYGILLMGLASIAALLYTWGSVTTLVTMYSINVFITFSLSTFGMCRFYFTERKKREHWKKGFAVQLIAFVLCFTILVVNIVVKFEIGAWLTLVVTSVLIGVCIMIRRYYRKVYDKLGLLSVDVEPPGPDAAPAPDHLDIKKSTAVLLVGAYGGLGVHALAQILRLFPDHFKQIVFVSVGIIDSGNFKGAEETERLKKQTQETLQKYEALARRFGLAADSMMLIGNDPVAGIEELCVEVALRYPKSTFFAGQLVFQRDAWYQRLLHNETAFAVQRRLQWQGLPMVVLPVRVWGTKKRANTVILKASGS
jgi:amino acid transporter